MKEAYVSFETAQLLKGKGFDWAVLTCYENSEFRYVNLWNWNKFGASTLCSAPTQQMAMRWLREEHNIFIGVGIGEDLDGEFGYMPFIHILDNLSCPDGKYVPDVDADDICKLTPQTYEDSVEAALQYALTNLI